MLDLRFIASNRIGEPVKDADVGAYDLPPSALLATRRGPGNSVLHFYFEYKGDASVIIWRVELVPAKPQSL